MRKVKCEGKPWRSGMQLWQPCDISELVGILKYPICLPARASYPQHCRTLAAEHPHGEEVSLFKFFFEGSEVCIFNLRLVKIAHYIMGFIQFEIAPFLL